MSRKTRTTAAFGAALVGVLLALVTSLTGVLPQAASVERVPASSSAPSLEGATAQLGHAVLRSTHANVGSSVSNDRTTAHGASSVLAGVLLVLALACLALAVRRARALRPSALVGARACRAPPAAARA